MPKCPNCSQLIVAPYSLDGSAPNLPSRRNCTACQTAIITRPAYLIARNMLNLDIIVTTRMDISKTNPGRWHNGGWYVAQVHHRDVKKLERIASVGDALDAMWMREHCLLNGNEEHAKHWDAMLDACWPGWSTCPAQLNKMFASLP